MVQKFLPHDNGSRPFAVYIDKNKVIVYKQKFDFEKNKYIQNAKPSLQFTFLKAFTGKRSKFAKSPQYSFQKGNSLLFKINATQYLYVGESIFTFKLQKGDKIINYYSDIGNNDVPYPYAVGEKYIYLVIENAVVPKEFFYSLNGDVYSQYYDKLPLKNKFETDKIKSLRKKTIIKRFG